MTSKIINMAERIKDADDRLLESMFASAPVADDGFSSRVVAKVRRRVWLRRLALPVAAAIGGLISFKPLAGLVTGLAGLAALVPDDVAGGVTAAIPGLPTILLGAILLAAGMFGLRIIDD